MNGSLRQLLGDWETSNERAVRLKGYQDALRGNLEKKTRLSNDPMPSLLSSPSFSFDVNRRNLRSVDILPRLRHIPLAKQGRDLPQIYQRTLRLRYEPGVQRRLSKESREREALRHLRLTAGRSEGRGEHQHPRPLLA